MMNEYGGTQEGSRPDQSQEWAPPGPETGHDVGFRQLGGEGESGYPERPEEPNCFYYLRNGSCRYGATCRFNHPRDRLAVLATRAGGGEFPERVGQPVCQYYMWTGMCKFGASCKYHHPKQGAGSSTHVSLNYSGYPLRPGEKECTYYMKTGQCKFGATCKFHHPQLANVQIPVHSPAPSVAPQPPPLPLSMVYPPIQSPAGPSSQQYGIVVARPPLPPGYVPSAFVLSPGVHPTWTPYPAPASPVVSPSPQLIIGQGTMYGLAQLPPLASGYTGAYLPAPTSLGPSISTQKESPFPERPGQQECQYYMRTGNCKFGSSCRYHHPPELMVPKTNIVLSPLGLPLRPGAPPCTHYTQRGECKFGAACRFDHPMGTLSYSPSASSLADMPVAPYPVGSSMGTLAPSSSSSDLRRELNLGSSIDSGFTRMSSSTSVSGGLIASTKSGPSSQTGVHQSQSGCGSAPLPGGSSSSSSIDPRTST